MDGETNFVTSAVITVPQEDPKLNKMKLITVKIKEASNVISNSDDGQVKLIISIIEIALFVM